MDKEKVRDIINNIERVAKSGQDMARDYMDKQPSQKSQNSNYRYILQDIRDLRKVIFGEDS
ncbi:hypothetical protein [Desulfonema magnum]|uniref:Uncharacterized protein n=1 Tax=Desulfonema magnum TaxID=45655 RepID=A0A975BQ76_9BACT|nr:hypothetical protein [Desulfonema magnum]QTA89618.1 Uncharacterized protein dnm_056740 [Desulfonema magnum]